MPGQIILSAFYFNTGGEVTDELRFVEKTFMTRAECQDTKYRDKEIKVDMICAAEAGKDSCKVFFFLSGLLVSAICAILSKQSQIQYSLFFHQPAHPRGELF